VNATAASLLGFLHRGPASGWDLVATAQATIGDFWPVTRSQVYRELAAMEAQGLVRAGPPGRRDRRPYQLTRAGRSAFARWVREPPGPEQIRFPLLLALSFGRHLPPGRLAGFLAEHRTEHEARLARYRAAQEAGAAPDDYAAAALAFGVAYESAVLAWFDQLPDRLTGGGGQARRASSTETRRPSAGAPR